ncbi:LysE family transporter [Klebsiella sp. BIGb0407]|uniref:LysE family transporter n=1 Tax=Klebsiella sp. BIGb0407 TaxID=2940603 RepID=UPI002168FEB3|nr:LysE family transporter [Klebsiella sp. BIGb0407]MCS3431024.1 threonine/homoserine/homoserine lactone efflux protein [Klebsiella sp. BIGb0407]
MLGIINYETFVLSFIIFLMIPGPGNLILITSTSKGGIYSGMACMMGIVVGDQVLLWLAIAGVATLLESSPNLFQAMKWLGAAYLLWIGGQLLFKSAAHSTPPPVSRKRTPFLQGMAITLTNPKPILFYMMFLPLFIDPVYSRGVLTFAGLAGTAALLTVIYAVLMIIITLSIADSVRTRPALMFLLEKVAGLFLAGFAIKLAFF